MKLTGIYQRITENGETKNVRASFESTGIKEYGKVIWRKLNKDGTPSNNFAEQFEPNVPWASGKWFCKVNSAVVLTQHPELKVETERSKTMTDAEYIEYLDKHFFVI